MICLSCQPPQRLPQHNSIALSVNNSFVLLTGYFRSHLTLTLFQPMAQYLSSLDTLRIEGPLWISGADRAKIQSRIAEEQATVRSSITKSLLSRLKGTRNVARSQPFSASCHQSIPSLPRFCPGSSKSTVQTLLPAVSSLKFHYIPASIR